MYLANPQEVKNGKGGGRLPHLALEPKRNAQSIRRSLNRLGKLGVRVHPYPESTWKGCADTADEV